MALIESGQNAELFKNEGNKYSGLKIGILLVGVSLGILLANILEAQGILDRRVAFPSMIFLFAGLSLIVSHIVIDKKKSV